MLIRITLKGALPLMILSSTVLPIVVTCVAITAGKLTG